MTAALYYRRLSNGESPMRLTITLKSKRRRKFTLTIALDFPLWLLKP